MSVPKNVFWFEILLDAALTLDALSVALQGRGWRRGNAPSERDRNRVMRADCGLSPVMPEAGSTGEDEDAQKVQLTDSASRQFGRGW
jgi:hypothetical protein